MNIGHYSFFILCNLIVAGSDIGEFENDCTSNCEKSFTSSVTPPKYLLYDVNPPEGFNLRRDVYMRFAVFMKKLSEKYPADHWHLVLPPWHYLYHWRLRDPEGQVPHPWSDFFDTSSMRRFSPIIEMHHFFEEMKKPHIEIVYVLQSYKGAFSEGWTWEDKWDFDNCTEENEINYRKEGDLYKGWFWGLSNISALEMHCVSFQGHASLLETLLRPTTQRAIMLDRAEVVLHDWFGKEDYWNCRRSMRFSSKLVNEANEFRKSYLNSTDVKDKTVRPDKWEDEKLKRNARGGDYLSVHLRRRDFVHSRSNEIPTIEFAAKTIENKLKQLQLDKVFVATDGSKSEISLLKNKLNRFNVFLYRPNSELKKVIKDGGVAIIDQIICSHARYFIGTHESTFSFRIQEEREILGFPQETTFNRFCPTKNECIQPTKWTIVH